jgi:hypothetical protein
MTFTCASRYNATIFKGQAPFPWDPVGSCEYVEGEEFPFLATLSLTPAEEVNQVVRCALLGDGAEFSILETLHTWILTEARPGTPLATVAYNESSRVLSCCSDSYYEVYLNGRRCANTPECHIASQYIGKWVISDYLPNNTETLCEEQVLDYGIGTGSGSSIEMCAVPDDKHFMMFSQEYHSLSNRAYSQRSFEFPIVFGHAMMLLIC